MAREPLEVAAPLAGTVASLADVPDEVFAAAMVGPGVAIIPDPGQDQAVVAPADGVVATSFPHAFALELADGRTLLVHLGVDTVGMRGAGFEKQVEAGAAVRAGDVIVTWSPDAVTEAGYAAVCPVVALQGDAEALELRAAVGAKVAAGDPLLRWI